MSRLGMVIDLDRCIGCWACATACKMENSVGEGLWWQKVQTIGGAEIDTSAGVFPQLSKHYRPRNCFHCANPPCLPVCPTGAITKRADGIVEINPESCIGCGRCVPACPFDAIEMNEAAPVLPPGLEAGHGAADVAPRRAGVAEKCTFCVHLVDKDESPACATACPTEAITFGDLDDPQSQVAGPLDRARRLRPGGRDRRRALPRLPAGLQRRRPAPQPPLSATPPLHTAREETPYPGRSSRWRCCRFRSGPLWMRGDK